MADFAELCTAVGGLLELPAEQAARVLNPAAAQPSVASAADALEHEATKLTLLASNALMPPMDQSACRRRCPCGLFAAGLACVGAWIVA